MRIGIPAAVAVAFLAAASAVSAACPPGKAQGCVNLDLAPNISQDIVAAEPPSGPKATPASTEKQPYTGPTIGFNNRVRRAPQIGYRWSFD
jgi:hypothetical protein